MKNPVARCEFERDQNGLVLDDQVRIEDLDLTGAPAWNSAAHHGHPPVLKCKIGPPGQLVQLHLVGIFGVGADHAVRRGQAPQATIALRNDSGEFRTIELITGRHYLDPSIPHAEPHTSGTGSRWTPVGTAQLHGQRVVVSHLVVDCPEIKRVGTITYTVHETGGTHVIFDVFAEMRPGCPFHSHGENVGLAELAAVVRSGDRVRFARALDQVSMSICNTMVSLDEAKSLALTFLGVVCAGLLELGASREMHGFLLNAARRFDQLDKHEAISEQAREYAESITSHLMCPIENPTHTAIDKALEFLDRNFAKKLTDAEMADAVGLSTSHFRHLFRQATSLPFQKYLMGLRLEKARQFIIETEMPLVEISALVGFASAPHFSRAFAERFGCSPSRYKDQIRLGTHPTAPVTLESA
ncbi:MAG: helix-turn-helix transcriptional regulator [Chthonomonas sp.]|nr:helix-turn-helix transcriptional regulator [Chthonomonas sp.]